MKIYTQKFPIGIEVIVTKNGDILPFGGIYMDKASTQESYGYLGVSNGIETYFRKFTEDTWILQFKGEKLIGTVLVPNQHFATILNSPSIRVGDGKTPQIVNDVQEVVANVGRYANDVRRSYTEELTAEQIDQLRELNKHFETALVNKYKKEEDNE